MNYGEPLYIRHSKFVERRFGMNKNRKQNVRKNNANSFIKLEEINKYILTLRTRAVVRIIQKRNGMMENATTYKIQKYNAYTEKK